MSTTAFERARDIVGEFVGSDTERDVVVFTKNTTEAINRLARSLVADANAVVLTTMLEHHSNDLPWRGRFRIVHIGVRPDGTLDVDDLDRRLAEHPGRIALLAVCGASNVTGIVQPVHEPAEEGPRGRWSHRSRRRPTRTAPPDRHAAPRRSRSPRLRRPVGPQAVRPVRHRRACGRPERVRPNARPHGRGHGAHRHDRRHRLGRSPDREEAGTPNVLGAVAMAVATRTLTDVGLDTIAGHESQLTRYAIDRLAGVPGLRIHGPTTGSNDRVGVIPFTIAGIDHGLVAAVLGYEHGVGVRSGCFCAHPYIAHLLHVDHTDSAAWVERASRGDKRGVPGMVRISFGCYNDRSDVDRAVHAIERVVAGDHSTDYRGELDGSFHPAGYVEPLLFSLDR